MTEKLSKQKTKERIGKLRSEINRHRYLYHVLDKPEISDSALDSLKNELAKLEEQFPELLTPDSPTQRVGGEPLKEFKKVRHEVPMLSLNDAFSPGDVRAWEERIVKLVGRDTFFSEDAPQYYAELKIDGLAISLLYQNNILTIGSTRGDGVTGEDVTQNLKTVEAIPLRLREQDEVVTELKKLGLLAVARNLETHWPRVLEVRGEVFINRKMFEVINREQKKKGLRLYANPRNVAAGSVRQLNPKITALRKLDSYAYDLITEVGQKTHEESHRILKAFGFKTNPHNKACRDLEGLEAFHVSWPVKRGKLDYEIDGIVVIVNDIATFRALGVVGKAPRGALAYKFALKEAETIIEDIKVQVGRTGALTPVAILKAVEVGGVTIRHATLHNDDEIKRLGLKIGDTVIIGRAGDVIPQVLKVLEGLRPKNAREFRMPKKCPACGTGVTRDDRGVIIHCPNGRCPARSRERLYHFTARTAFDIVGLGPKIIDKLVDAGLVDDPSDFFTLKPGDFADLEGFGEILSEKLVRQTQLKKQIALPRFLYALGILHVGEETAIALAREIPNLPFGRLRASKVQNPVDIARALGRLSLEDLQKIPDIGPIVAKSIYEWFHDTRNIALLAKLAKVGITIYHEQRAKAGPFAGKTFVFTGGLKTMSRDEAKEKARKYGADISESVSKETDLVVAGSEPGSKYKKAKKLGVKIISEKEFLEMLK